MPQTRQKLKWFCFVVVFLDKLLEALKDIQINDIVICDDFNCVLNNDSDRIRGEKHAERTVLKLNTVLHNYDLHDTRLLFNTDCRECTWSKRTPFVANYM